VRVPVEPAATGVPEVTRVLSVNIATAHRLRPGGRPSGIDKQPTPEPVHVRDPGPRGTGHGSGLVGDDVCDGRHHGGDDQAVYAYAREDLDRWAEDLGRPLPNGVFGENLTTAGIDIAGTVIGEQWRVGPEVVLEVSVPRIPCGVFRTWMNEKGWIRRFNEKGLSGTYLRVRTAGLIRPGDLITVVHRPGHGVDVGLVFRAMTVEPDLLPHLVDADELPPSVKAAAHAARISGGRSAHQAR
jgi:MOSC domain-containing protein YiiM